MADDRALLLKADYGAEPFWRRDGANVTSGMLTLTQRTRDELADWVEWFGTSAYWEHSTATETRYFPTPEEHDAFETEGLRLWLKVREEAGPGWLIGYYSLARRERAWDPAQLPKALFPANTAAPDRVLVELPPEPALDAEDLDTADFDELDEALDAVIVDIATADMTHEQRMAGDPVYAAAYERTLADLKAKPGAANPPAPSSPQEPAAPMSDPAQTSHEERMRTDPVYAGAFRAAMGQPEPEPGTDTGPAGAPQPAAVSDPQPASVLAATLAPADAEAAARAALIDAASARIEACGAGAAGWRALQGLVEDPRFAHALTALTATRAPDPADEPDPFDAAPDTADEPDPFADNPFEEPFEEATQEPLLPEAAERPAPAAPAPTHAERLASDPVYAAAYERQLAELRRLAGS